MKTIFKKEYDGESIVDIERDIMESFNPDYNPSASDIPQDEFGFQQGKFVVTIEWEEE